MNTTLRPLVASSLILFIALLSSCGGVQRSGAYAYEGGRSADGFKAAGTDRMVIMDATMEIRVANSDSTNKRLVGIAKTYGGYTVSLSETNSVFRVRVGAMDSALAQVAGLGKVRGKWLHGADVTEEFVDQELRLDNARKARERYLELLKQAENVQAALLVEKELERLNKDIEMLEGKQQKLEHLTSMATITVQLNEKEKLGPLGYVVVGLWKGVRWLFVRV
ncbi:MAG TPA: DUF4349 domain-containing protein [Flavobacteriales bacterium]|nr:DUF4349 domain-containing protein [Flavobacteriales bacterium]